MTASLRQSDTVGRLGGDEFAVVLPFTDVAGARRAAEKLLEIMRQPFRIDGRAITVAGSLGIAAYPDHATDIAALCKCADAAMYTAKRRRSGHFVYHPVECGQSAAPRC